MLLLSSEVARWLLAVSVRLLMVKVSLDLETEGVETGRS